MFRMSWVLKVWIQWRAANWQLNLYWLERIFCLCLCFTELFLINWFLVKILEILRNILFLHKITTQGMKDHASGRSLLLVKWKYQAPFKIIENYMNLLERSVEWCSVSLFTPLLFCGILWNILFQNFKVNLMVNFAIFTPHHKIFRLLKVSLETLTK